MGAIKDFWIKSLRGRMILLSLIIVNIPILVAGHLMKRSAEHSLLQEKVKQAGRHVGPAGRPPGAGRI